MAYNMDKQKTTLQRLPSSLHRIATLLALLLGIATIPLHAAQAASEAPSTHEFACLSSPRLQRIAPGQPVKETTCEASYDLPAWQVEAYYKEEGVKSKVKMGGYRGALFYNPTNNQVVLAHRGTDPANTDSLMCDLLAIALRWTEGQAATSEPYLKKSVQFAVEKKATLYITGHSLGGWLAQDSILRLQTKLANHPHVRELRQRAPIRCVTFDTPGAGLIFAHYKEKMPNISQSHITNYLSAPNPVNTCQPHIGQCYRLIFNFSNNTTLNTLSHLLEHFRKELKDNPTINLHHIQQWPHLSLEEEIDKTIDKLRQR